MEGRKNNVSGAMVEGGGGDPDLEILRMKPDYQWKMKKLLEGDVKLSSDDEFDETLLEDEECLINNLKEIRENLTSQKNIRKGRRLSEESEEREIEYHEPESPPRMPEAEALGKIGFTENKLKSALYQYKEEENYLEEMNKIDEELRKKWEIRMKTPTKFRRKKSKGKEENLSESQGKIEKLSESKKPMNPREENPIDRTGSKLPVSLVRLLNEKEKSVKSLDKKDIKEKLTQKKIKNIPNGCDCPIGHIPKNISGPSLRRAKALELVPKNDSSFKRPTGLETKAKKSDLETFIASTSGPSKYFKSGQTGIPNNWVDMPSFSKPENNLFLKKGVIKSKVDSFRKNDNRSSIDNLKKKMEKPAAINPPWKIAGSRGNTNPSKQPIAEEKPKSIYKSSKTSRILEYLEGTNPIPKKGNILDLITESTTKSITGKSKTPLKKPIEIPGKKSSSPGTKKPT